MSAAVEGSIWNGSGATSTPTMPRLLSSVTIAREISLIAEMEICRLWSPSTSPIVTPTEVGETSIVPPAVSSGTRSEKNDSISGSSG